MTAPEALTYDSLVSDVKIYAERQSDSVFITQIPRFIMLAENRIASEVKGLGLKKFVTGTLPVGNPVMTKPTRWRETESFCYTTATSRVYLKLRSLEYCRTYAPLPGVFGPPKYYADYDYEHYYIAQSADQAYPFELSYYERPDPLSPANQTSWTTQYAPQLLLYATLLESMPFLKNSERIAEFQNLYDRAVASIGHEDQQRLLDAESTRNKQ
jgi:hypothetical protein